jgi:hypothetical protein
MYDYNSMLLNVMERAEDLINKFKKVNLLVICKTEQNARYKV